MDAHCQTYGFKFKSSWIEKKNNFNSDGSLRKTVLVWVEADDDKKFWMKFLQDNPRYIFSYKQPDEAIASDGKVANGCNRIISLISNGDIVLSALQISCMDSDDSFIKGLIDGYTPPKPINDFIYYTTVYSIENAMLEAEHIDRTFEVVISEPKRNLFVSPSAFLEQISVCLFDSYNKLIFFDVTSQDRALIEASRTRFYNALSSLSTLDATIEYRNTACYLAFCAELDSLAALIETEIQKLNKAAEYSTYLSKLHQANIHPKNIYLFIKGHKIFDLTISIFENISKKYKAAAHARARKTYANPKSEINRINNSWHDYRSLIFGSFCIAVVNVDFLENTRLKLANTYA